MTKKIVAIWAQDEKGVIGKEERLPWQFISASDHFSLGRSALTYFFPSFTRQYHCITQNQQ